ncbi:ATP-binding cassette domain-containing protein [Micromonospora sediminicola]|uniref:ATP-binding cassette domain-containing protein n=1 Tax=Micromonospora sediminicola TaxID=946078 RepID=UPI0037A2483E
MAGIATRLIAAQVRRRPADAILVALLSCIEALPALLSGLLLARALDRGFLADRPFLGVALLSGQLVTLAAAAAAMRASSAPMARLIEPLRDELATRMVTVLLATAVRGPAVAPGAAAARLDTQVEPVRLLCNALLRGLRPVLFRLAAALLGLAALDAGVAAAVLVPVGAAAVVFRLMVRRVADAHGADLDTAEALATAVETTVDGIRDIHACGARGRAGRLLNSAISTARAAALRHARLTALRTLVPLIAVHLPIIGLLFTAPWLIASGRLSASELAGVVAVLVTGVAPAVRATVGTVGTWGVELRVVSARLADLGADLPAPPSSRDHTPTSTDVAAINVSYRHSRRAAPIITDLTMRLPADAHLAIVGESGTGKSTLAAIIAGLTPPDTGAVTVGGQPVRGSSSCGNVVLLVPQHPYVLRGSLRTNLTYLAPRATDADVDAAIDALGAGHLRQRLGGFDAQVQVDRISHSDKQTICLVRAYLSDAAVIILDEATAYLDAAAAARAETAFRQRHGTLIVVAHHVSSALRADVVLLLQDGDSYLGTVREVARHSARFAEVLRYWSASPETQWAEGTGLGDAPAHV